MRHEMMIRFRSGSKGMVLIAAALTIIFLVGMLGLTFDLARMYTAKNELQAYVDSASIAAAFELNGTNAGLDHARDKARNYPGMWNFQSTRPQNITVGLSAEPGGPYVENPASPAGIKYVQVNADAPVRLFFLPGFSTLAPVPTAAYLFLIGRDQLVRAVATSGQLLVSEFADGLLPYSPDAHDPADKKDAGLMPGRMYTLRWPPNGQRDSKSNWCDGDEIANFVTPGGSNDRGFIDIAGNGSSDIRDAIVNNKQTRPVAIGDTVVDDGGNRGTESDSLRARFDQDYDTTSQTYQQYLSKIDDVNYNGPKGNGRRFVIVPVRNGNTNEVVTFGGFFLHGDVCKKGGDSLMGSPGGSGGANSSTCCAEYVGPAIVGGRRGGSGELGAYKVRLFK
jgi:Flp pilus assembly protein TadG